MGQHLQALSSIDYNDTYQVVLKKMSRSGEGHDPEEKRISGEDSDDYELIKPADKEDPSMGKAATHVKVSSSTD